MRWPAGEMVRACRLVGLLAGLGCFLAGCAMVGPDYKPPTAKVATQWLNYEDPHLQTNSPVEPLWWKQAFQDPVLDQLIAKALADNLTLRSAALRVLQARQQLEELFAQERDEAVKRQVRAGWSRDADDTSQARQPTA